MLGKAKCVKDIYSHSSGGGGVQLQTSSGMLRHVGNTKYGATSTVKFLGRGRWAVKNEKQISRGSYLNESGGASEAQTANGHLTNNVLKHHEALRHFYP